MGVSGIIVAVRPEHLDACVRDLEAVPGVLAHQIDREGGRVVVTQEAEDLQAHETGLRRLQNVRHVLFAELVYHYTGDECEPPRDGPGCDVESPSDANAGS